MSNYPLEQAKLRDRYIPRGPRGSTQNLFKSIFFMSCENAWGAKAVIPTNTRAVFEHALANVRKLRSEPSFVPDYDPALFTL
jgi:hypothetical protein